MICASPAEVQGLIPKEAGGILYIWAKHLINEMLQTRTGSELDQMIPETTSLTDSFMACLDTYQLHCGIFHVEQ